MRRLYGYDLNLQPICKVNEGEAQVVQLIYQSYIDGLSLGGIVKFFKSKNIPSSSGNDTFHVAQCEK